MVIHQNRSQHSQKNFVDESMLDSFLDLVVWGHEHESHMLPQANSIMQFSVIQPGSSVATSLCEGETAPKYIFMLEVREGKCRVNAIRLATVRPMALQTVTLSAERELHNASAMRNDELVSALNTVITRKLDALVQECADRQLAIQGPAMLPLIRLRVWRCSYHYNFFTVVHHFLRLTTREAALHRCHLVRFRINTKTESLILLNYCIGSRVA